jgi:RNA polymerase sigma-70 factor (ECF subfamily)
MTVASLRQTYLEGARRWPLVKLSFEEFEAHCSAVLAASGDSACADLFLCCACARGDRHGMSAFQEEALPVARAAIANVRRDAEFVQETLQELWSKLLFGPNPRVAKFEARGPLQAWVRVTATRVALDRCRRLGVAASKLTELSDRFASPAPSVERLLSRARYSEAFQSALSEAVAALPPRDRNALRMHVSGRCSIDEIGRAYGVHRATAARWLERARVAISNGVRAGLGRRDLRLTDSEFRSLAGVVASGLELRLTESQLQSEFAPSAR